MIYAKNAEVYATVWKINHPENGKYIDVQITTSEKNKNGEYENSSWMARVIGHALNSLKGIKERDRIKITSFKMSNIYDKEKNRSFLKMLIFEAKFADNKMNNNNDTSNANTSSETNASEKKAPAKPETQNKDSKEDLPW